MMQNQKILFLRKQSSAKKFLPAFIALWACMSMALTGCGNTVVYCEETAATDAASTLPEVTSPASEKEEAFYVIYTPYGVSYQQDKNELYFKGELVRCFWDGVEIEKGASTCRCSYFNEKGIVDIHTLWEPTQNEDGSIDPFGTLKGIEKSSQKEFEERDLSEFYRTDMMEATTDAAADAGPVSRLGIWLADLFGLQKDFSGIFKEYESYGITYEEPKDGGMGNVYYNGQPVNAFIDLKENGSVFTFHSGDGGEINVQTVYDGSGKLTGVTAVAVNTPAAG